MHLRDLPAKRFRHTTDSIHDRPVASSVLAPHFVTECTSEWHTTDINFIWT